MLRGIVLLQVLHTQRLHLGTESSVQRKRLAQMKPPKADASSMEPGCHVLYYVFQVVSEILIPNALPMQCVQRQHASFTCFFFFKIKFLDFIK